MGCMQDGPQRRGRPGAAPGLLETDKRSTLQLLSRSSGTRRHGSPNGWERLEIAVLHAKW